MLVLLNDKDTLTKGSVCGIGSFDGVHRGHQAIVTHLIYLAGSKKKVGIITFTPLPFFTLKKAPICCLTPKEDKEKIFEQLGVDFMYYFKFSNEFAQLEPRQFVKCIVDRIAPSIVVVGENFHFGKNRKGTAQMLKDLAHGFFTVEIMPRVSDEGTISSTRIRELLLLGHIKAANDLLGREYSVAGEVIKGKGRGQRLGFPTVNIAPPEHKLLPLDGVYKVRVQLDHKDYIGAMFSRHDLLEIHILGFDGDLYKKNLTIKFLERIRGIEHFEDDASLKAAIASDINKITQ